jgi:hypothetical protein
VLRDSILDTEPAEAAIGQVQQISRSERIADRYDYAN